LLPSAAERAGADASGLAEGAHETGESVAARPLRLHQRLARVRHDRAERHVADQRPADRRWQDRRDLRPVPRASRPPGSSGSSSPRAGLVSARSRCSALAEAS